jgi:protein gp37
MADHSKIEWTEATLNVVTGCTRVSEGCDHCYIERTPPFRMQGRAFDKPGIGGRIPVQLHRERLMQALRWRRPRRIFMPSLGDLFHADVPYDLLVDAFAVMAITPRHTYQITTKRPARMRALLSDEGFWANVALAITGLAVVEQVPDAVDWMHRQDHGLWYPLPNTWLGVSVETQQWADIRIPALLGTPAAVRWLSCEPLLGPVDLSRWVLGATVDGVPAPAISRLINWISGTSLDWVVAGGESGPGARPMHPEWARSLRDRCQVAGVPFFFKQWGEHAPRCTFALNGHACPCNGASPSHVIELHRFGKRAAGRELDGRTWDQYPEVRHAG